MWWIHSAASTKGTSSYCIANYCLQLKKKFSRTRSSILHIRSDFSFLINKEYTCNWNKATTREADQLFFMSLMALPYRGRVCPPSFKFRAENIAMSTLRFLPRVKTDLYIYMNMYETAGIDGDQCIHYMTQKYLPIPYLAQLLFNN